MWKASVAEHGGKNDGDSRIPRAHSDGRECAARDREDQAMATQQLRVGVTRDALLENGAPFFDEAALDILARSADLAWEYLPAAKKMLTADDAQVYDVICAVGCGGLDQPSDLAFGPDGHLYVANLVGGLGDNILRFDGTSGAFIDEFATEATFNTPRHIEFAGGVLWAAGEADRIWRFDATTGAFLNKPQSDNPRGLAAHDREREREAPKPSRARRGWADDADPDLPCGRALPIRLRERVVISTP
jgi:hypothetical protein